MHHFGRFLAGLRIRRGLSQNRLAKLCNVSHATIYRAESKEPYSLHLNTAVAIVRELDNIVPLSDDERRYFMQEGGLDPSVWNRALVAAPVPPADFDPDSRAAVVDAVLALSAVVRPEDLLAFLTSLRRLLARSGDGHAADPLPALITPPEPLGDTHEVRQYIPTGTPAAPVEPKRRDAIE